MLQVVVAVLSVASAAASLALAIQATNAHKTHAAQFVLGAFALLVVLLGVLKFATDVSFTVYKDGALKPLSTGV